MKDIVICTASRSERELQQPLVEAFGDRCEVLELPVDFREAYDRVLAYLHGGVVCLDEGKSLCQNKPKVAFCSFDRPEMLGAAFAFYFNGVPIAQYHAGDTGVNAQDDYIRDMITMVSTFQFCNSVDSYQRCLRLLFDFKKPLIRCYEVGSFAMEGVKLDASIVPKERYDLILYNPPLGVSAKVIGEELTELVSYINKLVVWICPNEDVGRDIVIRRIDNCIFNGLHITKSETLPRGQFLALMRDADRVIGNSSSFFLELPFFRKDHIHVGIRNRYRKPVEPGVGASEKIVKVIEEFIRG
jgi:UDP-N-acetylglucosamine 2-epimerase